MDEKKPGKKPQGIAKLNEGEGNKTADKFYREQATNFARKNDTLAEATKAQREVEQRPGEFSEAERKGRKPAEGAADLPGDLSGDDFDKI